MNILVVKANNRPATEAISSKMYETFMENIEGSNVTTFDVFAEDMPYFGQDLFNAFGKLQNGEELTELEARLISCKTKSNGRFNCCRCSSICIPIMELNNSSTITNIHRLYLPSWLSHSNMTKMDN